MEDNQNKDEDNSCFDSISFTIIGAFIIIFELSLFVIRL